MRCRFRSLVIALVLGAIPCLADSIDFDSLLDGDLVINQFSAQAVTFQNTVVLGSGISLNELEFPPRSHSNVVSDNGGPMTISFASPMGSVFAFFTYSQALTMEAFDLLNNSLGSVSSDSGCASNLAISGTAGCAPNQQLSLLGFTNISSVVITGSATGGSFVLDDLNFEASSVEVVPEPAHAFVLAGGLVALWATRRRSR